MPIAVFVVVIVVAAALASGGGTKIRALHFTNRVSSYEDILNSISGFFVFLGVLGGVEEGRIAEGWEWEWIHYSQRGFKAIFDTYLYRETDFLGSQSRFAVDIFSKLILVWIPCSSASACVAAFASASHHCEEVQWTDFAARFLFLPPSF